jgi:hypothetical protein
MKRKCKQFHKYLWNLLIFLTELTKHTKDHDIGRWKSRVRYKHVTVLNRHCFKFRHQVLFKWSIDCCLTYIYNHSGYIPIMYRYVLSSVMWYPLQFHVSLRSEFCDVVSVTISVCIYLQLYVGGLMSYLHYLLLFAYSGVQHIVLCSCFVCLFLVCCVPSVASFSGLSMCIAFCVL